MPWKECHTVDERLRFVARLLDGEKMAPLCKEFGISRKTGYKVYDRYKDHGALGLTDRSRRPYRHANRLPLPLRRRSSGSSGSIPAGARRRSASAYGGNIRICAVPPAAPCTRSGSAWAGRPTDPAALQGHGHAAVAPRAAECLMVRGFQRGVSTRRSPVLFSADDYGLCEPVSHSLRSAVVHEGAPGFYRLRAHLPGVRVTGGDSHRQWDSLRLRQRAVWADPALGLVAAPWDRHRTNPTWPSRAERPSRAYASHPQARGHEARSAKFLAAASALRCVRRALQR